MSKNMSQSEFKENPKTKQRRLEEEQENFIEKNKHDLFDHLEPQQVQNNAKFSLSGMSGAALMFLGIVAVVVLGLYLVDFFRGVL